MLNPIGHGENRVRPEKFADLQFPGRCVRDPIIHVVCDLQWRDIFVPVLFIRFERDRAVPFLPAHGEKLFGRIRHERDIPEKEQVGIAAQRGFVRQRGQDLLKMRAEFFECIGRGFDRALQLVLLECGRSCERSRHPLQPFAYAVELLNRHGRKRRWRFLQILRRLLQDRRNVFDPGENFPAARFIKRCRDGQRFRHRP